MRITGGEIAPRDGKYQREFVTDDTGHRHRAGAAVACKAGEKLPGNSTIGYEANELRAGDLAPRDGVYWNNLASTEHAMKAGQAFPAADPAADFAWVRAITK